MLSLTPDFGEMSGVESGESIQPFGSGIMIGGDIWQDCWSAESIRRPYQVYDREKKRHVAGSGSVGFVPRRRHQGRTTLVANKLAVARFDHSLWRTQWTKHVVHTFLL